MLRKHLKDHIIILKRFTVNENDILLTAFGKHLGRITLKARGSKKITSRFTGKLEPLSCINAEIYFSGKSYTLTNANLIQEPPLGLNLENFEICQKICKLLNTTLANEHPNETVFQLIQLVVHFLKTGEKQQETLIFFYLKYLQSTGHLREVKELLAEEKHLSTNALKALRFYTENNQLSYCLKLKLPENIKNELLSTTQKLINAAYELT